MKRPSAEFSVDFQLSDLQPEDLAQRLRGMEWKVEGRERDRLEARQGSQATMRLLGGWFVNPTKLPKRLAAERAEGGMTITIDDSMGVMGAELRRKYEEAFADVERQLGG